LSDRNGVVDVTHEYIAACTGLSLSEVIACMARLCAPDRYSRSQEAAGAGLELLDPTRPWGWRVINYGRYREQARLALKNGREVETGLNAARMRARRRPPGTAANTHICDGIEPEPRMTPERRNADRRYGSRIPIDLSRVFTAEVAAWAREHASSVDLQQALEDFAGEWRGVSGARGRKLDWPAEFLRELQVRAAKPAADGPDSERPTLVPQIIEETPEIRRVW
jgi:hypothetical protein